MDGRERTGSGGEARAAKETPPDEADFDFLPQTVGFLLRRLTESYKAHFLERTQGMDLLPRDVAALTIIAATPGISPKLLGAAMGLDGAMTTFVLTALERRDLIRREKSPRDGRSRIVRLTPAGERLRARLGETVPEVDAAFTRALSAAEREELVRLLSRLWADRQGAAGD